MKIYSSADFFRVGKHYGAKRRVIQAFCGRKFFWSGRALPYPHRKYRAH
jgi:hypothetical protein